MLGWCCGPDGGVAGVVGAETVRGANSKRCPGITRRQKGGALDRAVLLSAQDWHAIRGRSSLCGSRIAKALSQSCGPTGINVALCSDDQSSLALTVRLCSIWHSHVHRLSDRAAARKKRTSRRDSLRGLKRSHRQFAALLLSPPSRRSQTCAGNGSALRCRLVRNAAKRHHLVRPRPDFPLFVWFGSSPISSALFTPSFDVSCRSRALALTRGLNGMQ